MNKLSKKERVLKGMIQRKDIMPRTVVEAKALANASDVNILRSFLSQYKAR